MTYTRKKANPKTDSRSIRSTVLILLIFLFSVTIYADESGESESAANTSQKRVVKIIKKTTESILAGSTSYTVSDSIEIIDNQGIQLQLKDLLVPCKATIYYEPTTHIDPIATKIVMLEADWGATTDWTPEAPE